MSGGLYQEDARDHEGVSHRGAQGRGIARSVPAALSTWQAAQENEEEERGQADGSRDEDEHRGPRCVAWPTVLITRHVNR